MNVAGNINVYVAGLSDTTWGFSPTVCTLRAYSASFDAFAAKVDLNYYLYLPLLMR